MISLLRQTNTMSVSGGLDYHHFDCVRSDWEAPSCFFPFFSFILLLHHKICLTCLTALATVTVMNEENAITLGCSDASPNQDFPLRDNRGHSMGAEQTVLLYIVLIRERVSMYTNS